MSLGVKELETPKEPEVTRNGWNKLAVPHTHWSHSKGAFLLMFFLRWFFAVQVTRENKRTAIRTARTARLVREMAREACGKK